MSTNRVARSVDFKNVTDVFGECGVALADIATALGASYSAVKQARLDPTSRHYRTPPPGWRPKLKELAASRGGRLLELAEELEG